MGSGACLGACIHKLSLHVFYPKVYKICLLFSTKFKLSVLFRDSEICFPVGTLENETSLAPEMMKIQMQLEAGMEMLQDITGQIELVTRLRENALKKLKKKSKNYIKLMDQAVESVRKRK